MWNHAASSFVLTLFLCLQVTDVARPVCHVVSSSPSCPSACCAFFHWEFMANFTDGIKGTGIRRVTVRKGNGALHTSSALGAGGENITVATYSASCCSGSVELAAVDGAGNVGRCLGWSSTVAPGATGATVAGSVSTAGHNLSAFQQLWRMFSGFFLWGVK